MTHALIGDRVILHAGVRIGQDGFGFAMGPQGHLKVPQIGRVIIQDDVEIGANSCVDRGALKDTIIGEGTKIDNLVQIGHNVVIGRHCVIVGQVGISGFDRAWRFRRHGWAIRHGRAHQDRVGRADRGDGPCRRRTLPPAHAWAARRPFRSQTVAAADRHPEAVSANAQAGPAEASEALSARRLLTKVGRAGLRGASKRYE